MVAKAIVKTDGTVVKNVHSQASLERLPAAPATLKFLRRCTSRSCCKQELVLEYLQVFQLSYQWKNRNRRRFLVKNPNGTLKDDTSWFASYAPSQESSICSRHDGRPRWIWCFNIWCRRSARSIQLYFGVTGSKVVSWLRRMFPEGKTTNDNCLRFHLRPNLRGRHE